MELEEVVRSDYMMRALSLAAASAALAAVFLLAHPKRWRMVMMLRVGLTTATKSSWSGRNHAKDALRTRFRSMVSDTRHRS